MERPSGDPVLICTKHRGVFFGFTEDHSGNDISLKNCRMAIRWNTTEGLQELAKIGPNDGSKIGASCDAEIRDVTAIFHVTEEAVSKWLEK